MNTINLRSVCTLFITTLFTTFIIIGCSNPANSNGDDHHSHPEGAVLQMNGEEIIRIEEGEIVSGNSSLEIENGDETPLITIYFLDHDGETFHPEEDHFSLNWDQIDTSVAVIEQHEEDGKWSFHLVGQSPGETEVRFRLWHEDENHSDFDTPPIPVTVN
ncbi:hypothetical protein LQ318_05675 [Aliifodinibius salicampi]|uniref:DUF4625 domain-containing protein n=1 Tax=Fodinibius salicampi TaxID=1920655 RepID=A0ABT3PX11_9BACT|nr:hypothetical protein [Fodinibius salicampi]MCW9712392.1 hypothetical protein [Fodinibius salicampi]